MLACPERIWTKSGSYSIYNFKPLLQRDLLLPKHLHVMAPKAESQWVQRRCISYYSCTIDQLISLQGSVHLGRFYYSITPIGRKPKDVLHMLHTSIIPFLFIFNLLYLHSPSPNPRLHPLQFSLQLKSHIHSFLATNLSSPP